MLWDISSLTSNAWFTLSLGIITILSFFGMIYFYYISKREKMPVYSLKSTNVLQDLSGKYEPLKVTYNGTEIKNLTVTVISFWNSGKETIRTDDIAAKDPLTVRTKNNVKILDVKMTIPKNKPNGFRYTRSDDLRSLNFTFDYIDKNQGVVFQLLHTGTSTKDIELTGNIIGWGSPKNINFSLRSSKQKILDYSLDFSSSIGFLAFGTIFILVRNSPNIQYMNLISGFIGSHYEIFSQTYYLINYLACIVIGSVLIILGIFMTIVTLFSIVDPIPEEFDI